MIREASDNANSEGLLYPSSLVMNVPAKLGIEIGLNIVGTPGTNREPLSNENSHG